VSNEDYVATPLADSTEYIEQAGVIGTYKFVYVTKTPTVFLPTPTAQIAWGKRPVIGRGSKAKTIYFTLAAEGGQYRLEIDDNDIPRIEPQQ
jgi:hypothetical protein